MCPSDQVTQEEEHSTRGRARLLFEMMHGHDDSPVTDGWRSTAVRDALDLCLACKGCKTDCPANVDMATYKAEFLAHHWAATALAAAPVRSHARVAAPPGQGGGPAAAGPRVLLRTGWDGRYRGVPAGAGAARTLWLHRTGPGWPASSPGRSAGC